MSSSLFVYMIPVAGHHAIHQATMKSHRYNSFWKEIFGDIMKTKYRAMKGERGEFRGGKSRLGIISSSLLV